MKYISVVEAAKKWGLTPGSVQIHCEKGNIPGVNMLGKTWQVPADIEGSRLTHGITPFVIAENFKQFYYLGLQDWRKGYHARLMDVCRTGQDVFILGLRQFGHAKLADKAIAERMKSDASMENVS